MTDRDMTEPIKEPIETARIEELDDDLMLIQDHAEARHVADSVGFEGDLTPSLAFVETADGAYSEVWISERAVPYNSSTAYRIV